MLTIRPATADDVAFVSQNLRKADLEEMLAAGVEVPFTSLMVGLTPGWLALVGVDEAGTPVTLFGVGPHPTDDIAGAVWAVATDDLKRHTKSFLKPSLEWVEEFNRRYPLITNFTDCRNRLHHRWLKWCGFTFINKVHGPRGFPFYEFVRLRRDNV